MLKIWLKEIQSSTFVRTESSDHLGWKLTLWIRRGLPLQNEICIRCVENVKSCTSGVKTKLFKFTTVWWPWKKREKFWNWGRKIWFFFFAAECTQRFQQLILFEKSPSETLWELIETAFEKIVNSEHSVNILKGVTLGVFMFSVFLNTAEQQLFNTSSLLSGNFLDKALFIYNTTVKSRSPNLSN